MGVANRLLLSYFRSVRLFIIVVAQFFCVSIWFALNPVIPDIIATYNYLEVSIASVTSMVQFGFITGTFLLAILNISDRFPTRNVFFLFAIIGAGLNSLIGLTELPFWALMLSRFLVGFSLAGVYPVGIKISAEYFHHKLGFALGFLVGALALGTSFPHALGFIREFYTLPWIYVVYGTSILSVIGAVMIRFCLPKLPKRSLVPFKWNAILIAFKNQPFRIAAFGYFVHMWELYAFWAFVPVFVGTIYSSEILSALSFTTIALGTLGCITAGILTAKFKPKRIGHSMLLISTTAALGFIFGSIFELHLLNSILLFIWGFSVIADSPMFSTVVAHTAPPEYKGSAITIVNSIGFGISILSIQLLGWALNEYQMLGILSILVPSIFFLIYQQFRRDKHQLST